MGCTGTAGRVLTSPAPPLPPWRGPSHICEWPRCDPPWELLRSRFPPKTNCLFQGITRKSESQNVGSIHAAAAISSPQFVTEGRTAVPLSPGCHGASNRAPRTPPHAHAPLGNQTAPRGANRVVSPEPSWKWDPTLTAPPTLSPRSPDSSHNSLRAPRHLLPRRAPPGVRVSAHRRMTPSLH